MPQCTILNEAELLNQAIYHMQIAVIPGKHGHGAPTRAVTSSSCYSSKVAWALPYQSHTKKNRSLTVS